MSGLDLYLSQRTLAMLFVYASLAGFVLGGVYDALRILRMLWDPTGSGQTDTGQGRRPIFLVVFQFFEDLLFLLVATVTLILLCYYINDGQLRAPAMLGMACGFFVYVHTLGRLVRAAAERLVRFVRGAVGFCLRLLCFPLRFLLKALHRLWRLSVGHLMAIHRNRVTQRQIQDLTSSAARGFDLLEETEDNNHEKT